MIREAVFGGRYSVWMLAMAVVALKLSGWPGEITSIAAPIAVALVSTGIQAWGAPIRNEAPKE